MTAAAAAARRVEVRPLSARAELANVVRFGMVVVVGAWMFLATDGATFGTAASSKHLLPFQQLIQDRPQTEQRMFCELQEGLLEAERRRADGRTWPAADALSADGIPPFAFDPTARGGVYEWRLMTGGAFVNYLGLPKRAGAPAWLVLVQEPEAGAPPDPARDEHHRLVTGEMRTSRSGSAPTRVTNGSSAPQAKDGRSSPSAVAHPTNTAGAARRGAEASARLKPALQASGFFTPATPRHALSE